MISIGLGVLVGVGFGWFYAIEIANFLMVAPKKATAEYVPQCRLQQTNKAVYIKY